LVAWFAVCERAFAADAPRKPNIVLILADDLGYETLGCNGCVSYKTPVLDKLAAEGTRFHRCYVQPLCTPTRVQLMTGQYNYRNYTHFGHIEPGQTTFAQLMKKAGYATCIAGKWQLGRDVDLPKKLGFDEHCLWQHLRRPPRYANPGLEVNGKEVDYKNGEYGPDIVSDYALDFITRKKDQPFLLYYPMMLTHGPYLPTPDSKDWDPKAMGEKANKSPEHFKDMVEYMDKLTGKLVARLEELKLRDNTLILFVGDNGTGAGTVTQTKNGPYIGGKGKTTDAGMHVPLIANWPGHVKTGAVCVELVDSTDFLPTLLEVGGASAPKELTLDGQSFWPQCRGEKGSPREWIYCWYAQQGGAKATGEFAMDKRFKLYRGGGVYDVARDPLEKSPIDPASLDADGKAAREKLQKALEKFAAPRPEAIVKQAGKGNKVDE
jgi:arylsulfatase A